jgi:hypothetical protein
MNPELVTLTLGKTAPFGFAALASMAVTLGRVSPADENTIAHTLFAHPLRASSREYNFVLTLTDKFQHTIH